MPALVKVAVVRYSEIEICEYTSLPCKSPPTWSCSKNQNTKALHSFAKIQLDIAALGGFRARPTGWKYDPTYGWG